ncbi:nickel-binding protein [Salimicrobium flavidum]|uniref:DUF4242 domain-containing protein n=1 Tax=Salimicrobium flavidum TaxID=570947 RepID=A0A1N7IRD6_9BACI|nr:nickel-binding protein [Salimicrobium flavidum]SIS39638.1 Protein of unknown function [Salimicrobium flavidum]
MSLFLVETPLEGISTEQGLEAKTNQLQEAVQKQEGNLIEVQVSKDFSRAFLIFESDDEEVLTGTLQQNGIEPELVKHVRLVGKDLEEVKRQASNVNYLVQWNLPEDLSMEDYLARKKKNSVHYADVPEVSFERTYVCEDMSKCLCFYDAPDEDAVQRAREAVKTPVDSITEISKEK